MRTKTDKNRGSLLFRILTAGACRRPRLPRSVNAAPTVSSGAAGCDIHDCPLLDQEEDEPSETGEPPPLLSCDNRLWLSTATATTTAPTRSPPPSFPWVGPTNSSERDPPLYDKLDPSMECRMTKPEAILLINAIAEKEKASKPSRHRLRMLVNSLLPPVTSKITFKELETGMRNIEGRFLLEESFHCTHCGSCVLSEATLCSQCETVNVRYPGPDVHLRNNHVVWVDIVTQLDQSFAKNHCLMEHHRKSRKEGVLRDMVDGEMMKHLREEEETCNSLNDRFNLSLLLQSDGGSKDKRSGGHMWPLVLLICDLPQRLRENHNNAVVACICLCFLKGKPPSQWLLKSLFAKMDQWYKDGRTVTTSCCRKTLSYSASIRVFGGDLQARQDFCRLVDLKAQDSCAFCVAQNYYSPRYKSRQFEWLSHRDELRDSVHIDFVTQRLNNDPSTVPLLGFTGQPLLMDRALVSLEAFHCVIGIWQLLFHIAVGTPCGKRIRGRPKGSRVTKGRGGQPGVLEDFTLFVNQAWLPTDVTNQFRLRGLLDFARYSRSELYWLATLMFIPYLAQVMPHKTDRLTGEAIGLESFYFLYIFALLLRKLCSSEVHARELDSMESMLQKLYEVSDRYLGINVFTVRFHTTLCHIVENTRKLGPVMTHSTVVTEQLLHFLKTGLRDVTKSFGKHAILHAMRFRALESSVFRLHNDTDDDVVKQLCETVLFSTARARESRFPLETPIGRKFREVVGGSISAKTTSEIGGAGLAKLEEMLKKRFRRDLQIEVTPVEAKIYISNREEKLLVRVSASPGKRRSQRHFLEYQDYFGVRRFLEVHAFVPSNDCILLFGNRLKTTSMLAGLPLPEDPVLKEIMRMQPPEFFRDFWFWVEKDLEPVLIPSTAVTGPAAVMTGADMQDNKIIVSCDTSFRSF